MAYLPATRIPKISGNKDGIDYKIDGLSLSDFKLDKKDVSVIVNPKQALESDLITVVVRNVNAAMQNVEWSFKQTYFPFLSGSGKANANVRGASICLGFIVAKESIRDMDDSSNTFEASSADYKPALIVSTTSINIETLDLEVHGTILSFVYNAISDMFAKTIKSYVISMLTDTILERMYSIQHALNEQVNKYWDKLNDILEIDLKMLPTLTDALEKSASRSLSHKSDKYTYNVIFKKPGPIGVTLQQSADGLYVSVARLSAEANKSGKIVIGHVLVAVNGSPVTSLPLDRVIARIKRVGRPLTLSFSDIARRQERAKKTLQSLQIQRVDLRCGKGRVERKCDCKYYVWGQASQHSRHPG